MQEYITRGVQYCMATGNWGVGKAAVAGQATRTGVSQVLSRLTFAAALSHLRRANTPIGKEGKIAQPRQLHNSHFGVVCPAETPEGQACGLVKNLSLMTYVSVGGASHLIIEILEAAGMEMLEEQASPALCADMRWSKIFLNGVWVGMSDSPEDLARMLRDQRRDGSLGGMIYEIGVARDIGERELFISTDHGRLMRPLLIVGEDGLLNLKRSSILEHEDTTWTELLRKRFIGMSFVFPAFCSFLCVFYHCTVCKGSSLHSSSHLFGWSTRITQETFFVWSLWHTTWKHLLVARVTA